MKYKKLVFKKDLYKKFLLFSILPLFIFSAVFLGIIYIQRYNAITTKHINIINNVQYNLEVFNKRINTVVRTLKNDKKDDIIDDVVRYNDTVSSILTLNQKGIVQDISSKTKTKVFKRYDYSNKLIFKKFIKTHKPFLSNIYFSTIEKTPLISYIFQHNNKIFIIELNLRFLDDLMYHIDKEFISNIDISIIDKYGLYIVDSVNKQNVYNRNSFFLTDLYDKYILKHKPMSLIETYNPEIHEDNFLTYSKVKNLSWLIVVKESSDVMDGYILNLLFWIILSVIIISFIIIQSAKRITNNIVSPIEQLTRDINIFASDTSSVIKSNMSSQYAIFTTLTDDFIKMQTSIIEKEKELKKQIDANQQKDKILYEQSKMAAMGEMIGNIAHQWRQPLSLISTIASGLEAEKEYGLFTDEKFFKGMKQITSTTQLLSQTIDDFRNFFKKDKEKTTFSIKSIVEKDLGLLEASFKQNSITLQTNYDDVKIVGYQNELIQALLNILNNAKDAFKENDIKYNRFIFLDTVVENRYLKIIIKDNAGGIPDHIIDKIFEPYFTTKHKSQGTGIGLYMTHEIIVNHMNGTIEAFNEKYKIDKEEFVGAMFVIKIPLDISNYK